MCKEAITEAMSLIEEGLKSLKQPADAEIFPEPTPKNNARFECSFVDPVEMEATNLCL